MSKMEIPVQWGEMDAARHVNNLVYLRWCESSRIDYFMKCGINSEFKDAVGPILSYQDCKYIFPMTFPDTAIITCSIHEIKEDRFILKSEVHSKKYTRIAAVSYQTIVPYDYKSLKKAPIPAAWMDAMNS